MKKKKFTCTACFMALALGAAAFAGCSAAPGHQYPPDAAENFGFETEGETGNYQYSEIREVGFFETAKYPASYFSLDRNTAGYSLMRSQINSGAKIASDSVRIEELINYFYYDYPAPEEGEGLKATAYLSECPWNDGHSLMTIGLKSEERVSTQARNNYVFLIDVSGSMSSRVDGLEGQSCLDLVKYGIDKLVDGLTENDSVSIVTYASGVGTALEATLATQSGKQQIRQAVNKLTASGATYGSGGLELAYQNAQRYFSAEGNNRIILMSDGDFNVGIRNETDLMEFIQEKAKNNIYLSVIGVGMGNMRDDFMQTLALNGNGNYAYIDTPREAQKALCEELNGLLTVVAKDAKAGVTFSQDTVVKYRLIGYDMKLMSEDDFNNSEKDAGEIGSNLCVTVLYEVELAKDAESNAKLADVTVRFKTPNDEEKETAVAVCNDLSSNDDLSYIACVAEFGLVLRNSQYRGTASIENTLARLNDLTQYLEEDVYKSEFKELVQKAKNSNYYETQTHV